MKTFNTRLEKGELFVKSIDTRLEKEELIVKSNHTRLEEYELNIKSIDSRLKKEARTLSIAFFFCPFPTPYLYIGNG